MPHTVFYDFVFGCRGTPVKDPNSVVGEQVRFLLQFRFFFPARRTGPTLAYVWLKITAQTGPLMC